MSDDHGQVYSENHWKGVFQVLDVQNTGQLTLGDLQELFPESSEEDLNAMLTEVGTDHISPD